jgi:hypothetical protein
MKMRTLRLRAVPSPSGRNAEKLFFDAKGGIFKLGQLALDESPEKDMFSREYKSSDEDPLSRLRAFLDNVGLSQDLKLQKCLDELERERGGGAGKGAQDDEDSDDDKLRRMLKEVPGLSAADADRICGIVADHTKRAKDESPANGMTRFTRYTKSQAMDSMESLRKIVPDIDRIRVGVF